MESFAIKEQAGLIQFGIKPFFLYMNLNMSKWHLNNCSNAKMALFCLK